MKTAVIGTGKTGGEVVKLISEESLVGPFNSRHKPSVEALKEADTAIIFVPGSAVEDIIEVVLESEVAAVWGSTGYEWPAGLNEQLRKKKLKWIRATNFSLGMHIVRRCIDVISRGSDMLKEPEFSIHEVHHTDKKDAPSGTALSWKRWLDREVRISSERKGDIRGIHRLTMETENESITLEHRAHRRAVFARGALWAAQQLDHIEYGFHDIESIFDTMLTTNSQ